MTKKVTKEVKPKMTKLQKAFIVGVTLAAATGLYVNHAKAADLLYAPKAPQVAPIYGGWYASIDGAANFMDDYGPLSFDTGYGISGAVGYNFGQFGFADLRTELEVGYLNSDADNVPAPFSVTGESFYTFANAFADFDTGMPFGVFVGGGLGYARTQGELSNGVGSVTLTDDNFAWNATAGLSYELTKDITLDIAYRYISIPDVTFAGFSDDVDVHQVNAGVRVKL